MNRIHTITFDDTPFAQVFTPLGFELGLHLHNDLLQPSPECEIAGGEVSGRESESVRAQRARQFRPVSRQLLPRAANLCDDLRKKQSHLSPEQQLVVEVRRTVEAGAKVWRTVCGRLCRHCVQGSRYRLPARELSTLLHVLFERRDNPLIAVVPVDANPVIVVGVDDELATDTS